MTIAILPSAGGVLYCHLDHHLIFFVFIFFFEIKNKFLSCYIYNLRWIHQSPGCLPIRHLQSFLSNRFIGIYGGTKAHPQTGQNRCMLLDTAAMTSVECDENNVVHQFHKISLSEQTSIGVGGNATVTGRNHHMKMLPV